MTRLSAYAASALALLLTLALLLGASQERAGRVPLLEASDREALIEHIGQRIYVVGTVASAEWSATGRVMNIEFAGGEEDGLLAVVFERQRERFDAAFLGDFAATITGRRLRLHGEIQEYGGFTEAFRGRPQMILNIPDRVTILPGEREPAPATRPATQPDSD